MSCSSAPGRINLKPSVWGRTAWAFLYSVAWGYPNTPSDHDKASATQLIMSLRDMLPCEKCRVNFHAKMSGGLGEQLKQAVSCSDTLFRYIYDLESAVAETTHRAIPSFEEVERRVKTNTYASAPAKDVDGSTRSPALVALWILLPVAIIVSVMTTVAIMRSRKQ